MTREGLKRAGLWTIVCFGLSFLWGLGQIGDCFDEDCTASQEHRRQVFLVAAPLIWLSGLVFFLARRRNP